MFVIQKEVNGFLDRLGSHGRRPVALEAVLDFLGFPLSLGPDAGLGAPEVLFSILIGLKPDGAFALAIGAVSLTAAIHTYAFCI